MAATLHRDSWEQYAAICQQEIAALEAKIEMLTAAIVSIGILNASGGHYDPEIDKVIRGINEQELKPEK